MVEDHLLDPAVETFLHELIEKGELTEEEVEEELGIEREDVRSFTDLLEREGIIQKDYSAGKGEFYSYTEENHEKMYSLFSKNDAPEIDGRPEKPDMRRRKLLDRKLDSYLSTYRKASGEDSRGSEESGLTAKLSGGFLH